MESVEFGSTSGPGERPPPAPWGRRVGWPAIILVFVGAAIAGAFLYKRTAGRPPSAQAASAPPPGTLIASVTVQLKPKAAIIADRYNCLCGDCHDTLGACTCTRDRGSNEMKTALNQIVEEKKTLEEIDAAMVARYGSRVLVSAASGGK